MPRFVYAKSISLNNVANNNNGGGSDESKLLRCKVLTLIIMGFVEAVRGGCGRGAIVSDDKHRPPSNSRGAN